MGHSQKYSSTHLDRNNDPRAQAERAAFQHVNANLRDMPYCELGDLQQAAVSYFWQSVRGNGAAHLFREEYVQRKADRGSGSGGIRSTRPAGRLGRTPSTRQRKRPGGGRWP